MSSLGQSLSEESETNRIPLCFQHSMKNCSYSGLFLLQNCFFILSSINWNYFYTSVIYKLLLFRTGRKDS